MIWFEMLLVLKESVAETGGKSDHGLPSILAIDFGLSSNEEINVRYEKHIKLPLAKCLH